MIFRKTQATKKKRIYHDRTDDHKFKALVKVDTYWFLFIPVYQSEKIL